MHGMAHIPILTAPNELVTIGLCKGIFGVLPDIGVECQTFRCLGKILFNKTIRVMSLLCKGETKWRKHEIKEGHSLSLSRKTS